MRFIRVTNKSRCPVCGKPDNCSIREDGKAVYCRRQSAGAVKEGRDGGHLHILSEDGSPGKIKFLPPKPQQPTQPARTRTVDEIHAVYTEFLSRLVLTNNHINDLSRRGLGCVYINLHGYKSMPTRVLADIACRQMIRAGYDLRGVPGFYRNAMNEYSFVGYREAGGYLIPIRNARYQIIALQLRRDDDRKPKYLLASSAAYPSGATSGTPPHFATLGHSVPPGKIKEIIITEGALKANVIFELSRIPTVGLVSVTTFNESLPETLSSAFPALELVKIAFDMDWRTNDAVLAQRLRLGKLLTESGLAINHETWNENYKGYDDYLLSKSKTLAVTV